MDNTPGDGGMHHEAAAPLLAVGIFANFVVFLAGDATGPGVRSVMVAAVLGGVVLLAYLIRKARAPRTGEDQGTRQ